MEFEKNFRYFVGFKAYNKFIGFFFQKLRLNNVMSLANYNKSEFSRISTQKNGTNHLKHSKNLMQ